jgi:hypothetical protein
MNNNEVVISRDFIAIADLLDENERLSYIDTVVSSAITGEMPNIKGKSKFSEPFKALVTVVTEALTKQQNAYANKSKGKGKFATHSELNAETSTLSNENSVADKNKSGKRRGRPPKKLTAITTEYTAKSESSAADNANGIGMLTTSNVVIGADIDNDQANNHHTQSQNNKHQPGKKNRKRKAAGKALKQKQAKPQRERKVPQIPIEVKKAASEKAVENSYARGRKAPEELPTETLKAIIKNESVDKILGRATPVIDLCSKFGISPNTYYKVVNKNYASEDILQRIDQVSRQVAAFA